MNVERQAGRYLRRMIVWRCVGAFTDLPLIACNVIHHFLTFLSSGIVLVHGFFSDISHSVFYLELDAARKHQLLTGNDFGFAAGDSGRYRLLDVEVQDRVRAKRLEENA